MGSLLRQASSLRWVLAGVLLPPAALLAVASLQSAVPLSMLTRDAVSVAEVPPYVGALSHLGVLLWCGSAAISLFTGAVLWRVRGRDALAEFLVWGALLTLLLMGDDLFTVHEVVAYYAGIPDSLITAVYAGLAAAYVWAYRRTIWTTEYLLLALSVALLGASLVVDALNPKDSALLFALVGDRYHLVEDGPKLLGIAAWLGYYARVSWVQLTTGPEAGGPEAGG